ncbi:hypothetical protein BGX29_011535 [Mortierella sp. GBA35]|nr:hypothetical protein BGX29_011535 [Mortierella sp. GBA35]KAG0217286.1 hypothetical protein BGX33_010932 [Mortierella sp. NVP41]
MTKLSIFDIPLIVDTICNDLSVRDIHNCRKASKSLRQAFLRARWRDIVIQEALTDQDLKTIAQYAPWIRTLKIDYFASELSTTTYNIEGTILPVLPKLTLLTRVDMEVPEKFNPGLLFDILMALPESVRILELGFNQHFNFGWMYLHVDKRTVSWKPNKLKRIYLHGHGNSGFEDLYLISLIKSSPELQALRIPCVSDECAEEFMMTLGKSCPKLRYLYLNKTRGGSTYGAEAMYFKHIKQPLKVLRIDLAQDGIEKVVISTLLSHSAHSLRELRFHNMKDVPNEYLEELVEKCPNLEYIFYRPN